MKANFNSSDTAQFDVHRYLGRRDDGKRFKGQLDGVLTYTRVLTAEELEVMYASLGAWYPKNTLVARWAMGDNGINTGQAHINGSKIEDSVGHSDGTVSDGSDNSMTLESSPQRKQRGRR